MNTTQILARVNEIAALAYEANILPVSRAVCALRDDLEAQVRLDTASSKGALNATKSVVAMLNGAKKDGRKTLSYAWIDADGRQCVCDGFRAYRLRDHLPLEPRPDDAGEPIDLGKVFPDTSSGLYAAAPLPSIAELRAFIAIERAKSGTVRSRKQRPGVIWRFADAGISVNADYLLDLLAVFPEATQIMYNATCSAHLSPLMLRTERGDAILLPLRDDTSEGERREIIDRANERLTGFELPKENGETLTCREYACRLLHGSDEKPLTPDDFALALDLVTVA